VQTHFSPEQLSDPKLAESEKILRKCVHCGFCTATCPTYVTLGNELDSPRGRIYLIKDMLENGRPAGKEEAKHIDRCLSCLSCTTTCPSGVDYMHLIDHARSHVEKTFKRPLSERMIRSLLAKVLPYPKRFRVALNLARLGRPFAPVLKRFAATKSLASMLALAPKSVPSQSVPSQSGHSARGIYVAKGEKRGRVALLTGCAQSVLDPDINAATIRLLNHLGVEVVLPDGETCCGSLTLHMGREEEAKASARRNVQVWSRVLSSSGLDAILMTASGCGTTIKDYGHLLKDDPIYAEDAAKISSLAKDITEYLFTLDLPQLEKNNTIVAYNYACSLQHGQKVTLQPKALLRSAGFTVRDPAEGHLCCGSAGTYNILQSEIADELKTRKVKNIEATKPDVISAGNIGCLTQIGSGTKIPIHHTIQLLEWAYAPTEGRKALH
jgi:glycolate oxidase iron-sulfur subunit